MTTYLTSRDLVIRAEARRLHGLLTRIESWPLAFSEVLAAEVLHSAPPEQLVRVRRTDVHGPTDWICRCVMGPAETGFSFRLVASRPPVAELGGHCRISPLDAGTCLVTAGFDFRVIDDEEHVARTTERELARIADADLASLKRFVEAKRVDEDG